MQASVELAAAGRPSLTTRFIGAARRYLPRGDMLPEEAWRQRHRATLILLWLHVAALPIVGRLTGHGLYHSMWESGIVAFAAVVATSTRFGRAIRMLGVTLGLITSSALLVHFSGGLIEMHFHFFVMVAVITLYQAWLPFLVALGYVVIHHGVMGALEPHSVYNHPAALSSPWKWALVHGFFILGESAALLVVWRLNENSRAEAETSYQQQLDEEHARLEAQERYREIFDNAVEGIYEVDLRDGSTIVNPAIALMLGYSSVDELFASGVSLADMQVDPASGVELLRLLEANDAVHDFEYQVRRKDGTLWWVSNNARAVRDTDGVMIGIQGTVEDVTERRLNEELLKEREEQFRILFQ
ncbi:MAG: PAS domain-containing protein, partial [Actinomycetota bacterium]